MNVILFLLATIGFTNIVVHGRVLDLIMIQGKSVRNWMYNWTWSEQLFSCYECAGFWTGILCGLAIFPANWYLAIFWGFAGSVAAKTYNDFSDWLTSHILFEVNDGEK